MDQIKKYKIKNIIYLSFFTVIFFSCGSYQYSGYVNDGIYESNETVEQYASAQENTIEPFDFREGYNTHLMLVDTYEECDVDVLNSVNNQ